MIVKQLAIEIRSQEVANLVYSICPDLGELDYEEELKGKFFMLGFPEPGKFALVPSTSIKDNWEYINPDMELQLFRLVR